MIELLKIIIDKKFDNFMIKELLYDHYDFSRKSLSKIKKNNGIYLNEQPAFVTVRVKEGDLLQVFISEETSENILPEPIPLNIVHEDNDIVILNKPPNIVVHPTRSHYTGTIANGLVYYWASSGKQFRFRPVNRLDKDTSGLFIVAKNQYAHHKLALQMKKNTLKRTYHAVVHKKMQDDKGEIKTLLIKDPNHPLKRIVVDQTYLNAKKAITYFKVMERFQEYTLVELLLGTGRTHQIRVHSI